MMRGVTRAARNIQRSRGYASATECVVLGKDTNQALGIAEFAIDFMNGKGTPNEEVLTRTRQFHTDSVMCGLSALAQKTNAPLVLRDEALTYGYEDGATCFGSNKRVFPEKAIVANSNAVREWD